MANDSHAHRVMSVLEGRYSLQKHPPDMDAVLRASWTRSITEHGLDPDHIHEPDVLTHAELQQRRAPVEEMSAFSLPEIDRLYQHLSDHAQVVMLTDAQGVVMHFRSSAAVVETCSTLRVLPGSVWSEERQGTTGVGLCLREQKPLSIVMSEHFATKLAGLSCTVAPVFGAGGRLAGVLNVTAMQSTDHTLQGVIRHMVASSARRIENVLFDRRHARTRVVRLSRHDDFCDTAAEARLALDEGGRIIDATPPASRLLAVPGLGDGGGSVALIGRRLGSVVDIGDLGRLERDPVLAIDARQGRIHLRLSAPSPRRSPPRPQAVEEAAQPPAARGGAATHDASGLEGFVGRDGAVLDRLRVARRLHARGLPLLLQGESGSGKTHLARALHEDGPHRGGRFVAINCAAIPAELIESELFGHRAGAFTGASRQGAPGRLLGAHQGTLFLDEIGDMPAGLQGRLLQVLSEGEFVPVGATEPVQVRFALVSATLHDLQARVQEGRFREDLYYRLSGATLVLPPLRERQDLGALIEQAFIQAAAQAGVAPCPLSYEVREVLLRHRWPGNMRELQHVARFSVALHEGPVIGLDALPAALSAPPSARPGAMAGAASEGARVLSDARTLLELMVCTGWNVSAAAARIGVSRATLHRRLHEFQLRRPARPGKPDGLAPD